MADNRRDFMKKVLAVPAVVVATPAMMGAVLTMGEPPPKQFRFKRTEANVIANALAGIPSDEEIMSVEMSKHGSIGVNLSGGDSLIEIPYVMIKTWSDKRPKGEPSMKTYVSKHGALAVVVE